MSSGSVSVGEVGCRDLLHMHNELGQGCSPGAPPHLSPQGSGTRGDKVPG